MAEKYEWTQVAVAITIPEAELAEDAARMGLSKDEYLARLLHVTDGIPVENWPDESDIQPPVGKTPQ